MNTVHLYFVNISLIKILHHIRVVHTYIHIHHFHVITQFSHVLSIDVFPYRKGWVLKTKKPYQWEYSCKQGWH